MQEIYTLNPCDVSITFISINGGLERIALYGVVMEVSVAAAVVLMGIVVVVTMVVVVGVEVVKK